MTTFVTGHSSVDFAGMCDAFRHAHLLAYLPTIVCLPTFLPAYLPTDLPTHLLAY